ncbi:MAG: hypothetical protein DRJ15_16085 [Bacteroidetes bacterium]|nr:MAG: hypothetical protein DRJ15_16085 [Bacteroidota bacterium]
MSGVTFSDAELTTWQARTFYKTTGDRFTDSPGAYDVVDFQAATFIADPTSYLVTVDVRTLDPNEGGDLLAAAFKYIVEDSTTHGNAVKTQLLAQILESASDYSSFTTLGTGSDHVSFSSRWVARLFNAYDYTKALFTTGENADMEAWFYEAGLFFMRSLNERIFLGQFPNRNADDHYDTNSLLLAEQSSHSTNGYYYSAETNINYELTGSKTGSINDYTARYVAKRDYTTLSGVASSEASYSPVIYTHYNSSGVAQSEILLIGGYYKNPMGMMADAVVLIGALLDDAMMLDHAKLWVEENLKYGTFPDGTIAEYRRNGDYGVPQQGAMFYGIIVIESLVLVADVFRRRGDTSVYEYSTSIGIGDSAGGSKTIKLVLDAVVDNCTGDVLRYYDSVSSANLIDTLTGTTRFLPETLFGRANIHYNDDAYKNTYLLNNATNTYDSGYSHPTGGADGTVWGGPINIEPAKPYQTNEMEAEESGGGNQGAQALLI